MSELGQFYVYMHCKPDLTPFYVGKGTGGRSHEFCRRSQHHNRVVMKYGRENIQIVVTKKDSEKSAFKSEIRLIRMLRSAGFVLCNHTDGGEGTSGRKFSPESRAKLSDARRGRKASAETRAKLAAINTGKKLSTETRAKISAANSGRAKSAEHRARISVARKGKKLSLEHRTKLSAAHMGEKRGPHSAEHRAKLSVAAKSRKKFQPKGEGEIGMTIKREDDLVKKYIQLRDIKERVKAEYDAKAVKIEAVMEQIEADLMTFLNKNGLESANTKAGTFFKRTTTSAKVADRDVFLHFVIEHDALNFLESRVSKTAVEEYVAEHGTIPPGIDVTKMVQISVNRPKTRS